MHKQWNSRTSRKRNISANRSEEVSVSAFLDFLKKNVLRLIVSAGIGGLAGYGWALNAEKLYSSSAQIIIDPKLSLGPLKDQPSDNGSNLDSSLVDSQILIMQSKTIMYKVAARLKLGENQSFLGQEPTFVTKVMKVLTAKAQSDSADEQKDRLRAAAEKLENSLNVKRLGLSYIIDISVSLKNAKLAAEAANAIADAYVQDQLENRSNSVRQGSDWLENRIQDLRRQMNTASRLVQQFRATHDYSINSHSSQIDNNDNKDFNTLEELESTAQTYRKIYDSFLQALAVSTQRETFPIAGARVISPAEEPYIPAYPRTKLIVIFGCALGMIGCVLLLSFQSAPSKNKTESLKAGSRIDNEG